MIALGILARTLSSDDPDRNPHQTGNKVDPALAAILPPAYLPPRVAADRLEQAEKEN